jgi:hypothetical protein
MRSARIVHRIFSDFATPIRILRTHVDHE